MKKLFFVFMPFLINPVWAMNFEKPVLDNIFAATYEVVVAKPAKDNVEYERELPLNLLPFQYRNDKYYSIGSAFRINGNKFVSAAHVVALGRASQNNNIGLRDTAGKVYPIDKVYKYSSSRDFIVFTVKDLNEGKSLKLNTNYKKNNKVYAVGNALGEGVVIRDGLYTSDTPEEQAGKWNWIRFSAAASPGNSGGPLLDENGNAIGVILRKSKNENLNFALPVKEVLDFKDEAVIKSDAVIYKLDISNDTSSFKYDKRHALPMGIVELNKVLQDDFQGIFENAAKDFLKKHEENLFPNGNGSLPLLYNRFTSFFPQMISKGDDNIWNVYEPKKITNADTGDGGRVKYGQMGHYVYLKIKRPEKVDFEKYYSDSKMLMDQILKGINYRRLIGPESVNVTSMGKSIEDRNHIDDYGRKWQVRSWLVNFSDQKIVLYALPTPDGYAAMMSITSTGDADMMEIDMKILANNLYLTYYGTVNEWTDFLKQKDITPSVVKNITIDTDKKSYIRYKDSNFEFSTDKKIMKVSKDSDIQLRFSYFNKGGKVVWEPVMVVFGENKNARNYASVSLNINPPESLDEQYRTRWGDIIAQRSPYNARTYLDDTMSNITIVKAKEPDDLQKNKYVYAISWHEEGTIAHDIMESKVKNLVADFKYSNE